MNKSSDVETATMLDRREAIRRVAGWLGGIAVLGGGGLVAAVARAHALAEESAGARIGEFTAGQIALLDEIAETILPATRTPGAKAAKTGAFMALMVTDAYDAVERQAFLDGMRDLDVTMRNTHQVSFMQATPAQRLALLMALDVEQKRVPDQHTAAGGGRTPGERRAVPYFRMMKELAMLGFFTSELGCTQALRYVETPGRYDPCIPYVAGEPAWALHA